MLGKRIWRIRVEVAVVASALAFAIITDFRPRRFNDFYLDHPMTASILSGLVMFAVAALVFEGWLKDREARQWERVAAVSYQHLADVASHLGRKARALVRGEDLYKHGVAVRRDLGPEIRSFVEGAGLPLFDKGDGDVGARLGVLLDSYEYVWFFSRELSVLQREHAQATADWAPVMLATDRLADDLGRFSELGPSIANVKRHLWQGGALNLDPSEWAAVPEWKQEVVEAVLHLFEHAQEVHQHLQEKRPHQPAPGVVTVERPGVVVPAYRDRALRLAGASDPARPERGEVV